jgi:hypothetical protein
MNNGVPVQRVTHQVTAQVPVRREWTIETERFLHFQERKSSTTTALGTGRFCSSRWATRNIRAHTNTDIPGCRCNTGSKVSIFSSPSPFYSLPCCASSVSRQLLLSTALLTPPRSVGECVRGVFSSGQSQFQGFEGSRF